MLSKVFGYPFGTARQAFDDFDVVCVFELLGEAVADVAAAGNHDAAGAGFFGAQFGYDRPDVFGGGGKQDFVAFDDDGLRRGDDEAVVAVNGADLAVGPSGKSWAMSAMLRPTSSPPRRACMMTIRTRSSAKRKTCNAPGQSIRPASCSVTSCSGLMVSVMPNMERLPFSLFSSLGLRYSKVFAGTDARDAAGDVEQVGGNFAGDDVGFVAAGEREQQVGIFRAGAF